MAEKINPPSMYNSLQFGFSHAARSTGGTMVHFAGQVAWDKEGNLVGGDDVAAQAEQVFANLKTMMAEVGATVEDLVMIRTYVVNHTPDKLGLVAPAMGAFFGEATPPPNTWIGVQALALPDILIEVEAAAVIG
ncbi:MAG: RidA family protein [Pseudomonadota bacterium]